MSPTPIVLFLGSQITTLETKKEIMKEIEQFPLYLAEEQTDFAYYHYALITMLQRLSGKTKQHVYALLMKTKWKGTLHSSSSCREKFNIPLVSGKKRATKA